MAKREIPEINASSLADIAFLLLTFFLVATTLNKPIGIKDTLPDPTKISETISAKTTINNQLLITIDDNNVIRFNNDKVVAIENLEDEVLAFLDNGLDCKFCKGAKKPEYSTHPANALIQLKRTKKSTHAPKYAVVAAVENVYEFMRNRYAQEYYDRSWKNIQDQIIKSKNSANFDLDPEIEEMKEEIEKQIPIRFGGKNAEPKESL